MEALRRLLRGRKRSWGPVLVSALVGGAVFWEVRQVARARAATVSMPRYLIAARNLSEGMPLSLADLGFRHAGGHPVPTGALTDQELHFLADSRSARAIREGDWITWSVLTPVEERGLGPSIPRGLRAYHLEIEGAPAVFSRDRIDVYWSAAPGGTSQTLLEAVSVLRVKREGARQGLDLAVSEDDVSALEKARGAGRLSLSVRHPEDARRGRRRGPAQHPTKRRIDVWTDRA